MVLKRSISDEQVLQIRNDYFIEGRSLVNLSKDYGYTVSLLRKAIHGLNGYKTIQDTIPQQKKENREEERAKAQTSKYFEKKFFEQLYENNPSIRPTHKPKQRRTRLPKSLADNVNKAPQWTPAKEKKFQEEQANQWWND